MKIRKTLIIPVVATMLAVSCSPTSGGDWSKEVKEFFNEQIGEVLPYVSLDKNSVTFDYEYDEFGGYFLATDANLKDKVDGYEKKLEKAEFVFDENQGWYYKETSIAKVAVSFDYDEGAEEGDLGENWLQVMYVYKEAPALDWTEAAKTWMTSKIGTVIPYANLTEPEFESATGVAHYIFSFDELNKVASYPMRLSLDGWEYKSGSFYKETTLGKAAVSYAYLDTMIEIDLDLVEAEFASYPASEVELFYNYKSKADSYVGEIPEFAAAGEEISFVYCEDLYGDEDEYIWPYGDIYAFGVTKEEVIAYAYALEKAGWLFSYVDEEVGSYCLIYPNSNAYADIELPGDEDEYDAWISFQYLPAATSWNNSYVANTMVTVLGLNPETNVEHEEGSSSYIVWANELNGEFESLEAAFEYVVSLVPGCYVYDESGKVVEEDNIAIDMPIEDYEDGLPFVSFYVTKGETEGAYGLYMVIDGTFAPLSANQAATVIASNWNAFVGQQHAEVEDVSEDWGTAAYNVFLAYSGMSVDYMEYYVENVCMNGVRGFVKQGDWQETSLSSGGTGYVLFYACADSNIVIQCLVYDTNYQGTVYNCMSITAYEDEEEPEEPTDPEPEAGSEEI